MRTTHQVAKLYLEDSRLVMEQAKFVEGSLGNLKEWSAEKAYFVTSNETPEWSNCQPYVLEGESHPPILPRVIPGVTDNPLLALKCLGKAGWRLVAVENGVFWLERGIDERW